VTRPAPDRTTVDLVKMAASDALRHVADWLDDGDNHLSLGRPGGLPTPWFNLNAAHAVVHGAAQTAGTQWHYQHLADEIVAKGGKLDQEDGSVSWPGASPAALVDALERAREYVSHVAEAWAERSPTVAAEARADLAVIDAVLGGKAAA
jgi:hypothetical protein